MNLEGAEPGEIIAYKAKRYAPAIELDKINFYATEEFWEVRHQNASKSLILEPGDFYILASKERVSVPPSSQPRWCLSIHRTASSAFITRDSSIPDSATAPATSRGRRGA
jgi:hypothetical protein